MIYILFYADDPSLIPRLKRLVEEKCDDANNAYLCFDYTMDILDYLNKAHPQNCAVFCLSDKLREALEFSSRLSYINPRYRFNLICESPGDVEELFINGVSYYIKAPYSDESVIRCVNAMLRQYNDQMGVLTLKSGRGNETMRLADIDYVMSDKREVVVNMSGKESSFYYKLDEIEQMLGDSFLRCHQSYIVNMKKIKQFIEDGLLLLDDCFIPVSRKRYYAAKRLYLSYITGNKMDR